MTTLADAQAAFRHSPGRVTALAYMDAAIAEWDGSDIRDEAAGPRLRHQMKEIRDWLMNERTS